MAKEKNSKKEDTKEVKEKISLWAKFMRFINGVKTESKRIHWTTKNDLKKYSIATLVFVIFFSLFFYIVNLLFALLHTLIG